jgi:epsin
LLQQQQQQQQPPQQTNPFSFQQQTQSPQPTPQPQQQPTPQPTPVVRTRDDGTNQHLASLFANRVDDGVDSFGNVGALRSVL